MAISGAANPFVLRVREIKGVWVAHNRSPPYNILIRKNRKDGIVSCVTGTKQLHTNADTRISSQETNMNRKVNIAKNSNFPRRKAVRETGITEIFFSVPLVYSQQIIHAPKTVRTIGANKSIKNISALS